MELKVVDNRVIVEGEIHTVKKIQELRNAIESLDSPKEIIIRLNSAIVIPSSLIGTLLRIIKENNKPVTIEYFEEDIYVMLDKLQLATLFNATRVY